jgi:hypothetical protein
MQLTNLDIMTLGIKSQGIFFAAEGGAPDYQPGSLGAKL